MLSKVRAVCFLNGEPTIASSMMPQPHSTKQNGAYIAGLKGEMQGFRINFRERRADEFVVLIRLPADQA